MKLQYIHTQTCVCTNVNSKLYNITPANNIMCTFYILCAVFIRSLKMICIKNGKYLASKLKKKGRGWTEHGVVSDDNCSTKNDSYQSKSNRLTSDINAVTRDLVKNELFALQVERQLRKQNTRIWVEWPNSNTAQNRERLSEEIILSNISKILVCQEVL